MSQTEMGHAIIYTPSASGLCAGMYICDNTHQTGITSFLVLILFNITLNMSVKILYLSFYLPYL